MPLSLKPEGLGFRAVWGLGFRGFGIVYSVHKLAGQGPKRGGRQGGGGGGADSMGFTACPTLLLHGVSSSRHPPGLFVPGSFVATSASPSTLYSSCKKSHWHSSTC